MLLSQAFEDSDQNQKMQDEQLNQNGQPNLNTSEQLDKHIDQQQNLQQEDSTRTHPPFTPLVTETPQEQLSRYWSENPQGHPYTPLPNWEPLTEAETEHWKEQLLESE